MSLKIHWLYCSFFANRRKYTKKITMLLLAKIKWKKPLICARIKDKCKKT